MRKRVDKNQAKIVKELRGLGFSVAGTHNVGGGFPDIVVGFELANDFFIVPYTILVEIKNANGKLGDSQIRFFENFNGSAIVAYNTKDILDFIEYIERVLNVKRINLPR